MQTKRTFMLWCPVTCTPLAFPLFIAIPAYGLQEGSTVTFWDQPSGNGTPENILILDETEELPHPLLPTWAMNADFSLTR